MEKKTHRDIYKTRAAPEQAPGAAGAPEPAGANRALSRTVRNATAGLLLMLGLLGLAAWIVVIKEQKGQKPEFAEEDALPPAPVPDLRKLADIPQVEIPATTAALLENITPELAQSRPALDAEQIGRVVDLARSAQEHLQLREWDASEELLRQALEISPDNPMILRLLGTVFVQQGRFDQAVTTLKQTLEQDPFRAEAYANLAAAYMHKGQFDLAEEFLLTALRVEPGHAASLLNLGLLYLATEKHAWAADYFARALEIQPANVSARNNLGVALLRLGRLEEARAEFEALATQNPDLKIADFNVAVSYALQGDAENALRWIRAGAARCSPAELSRFLADPDFGPLRNHPEFQALAAPGGHALVLPGYEAESP